LAPYPQPNSITVSAGELGGIPREDGHLRAGDIVLRKLADPLEKLRTMDVIEETGRNAARPLAKDGAHRLGERIADRRLYDGIALCGDP
jgi:hypothetical protein